MRPTNGEISVTPASAQATAWAKLNSRVRLQWMPSFSSTSAARMPSQVEAILIRMRSRSMPCLLVHADQVAAPWRCVASVSKREARVDLGRDAARHDLEDLAAEGDGQAVHERLGLTALSSPPGSAASA